MLLVFCHWGMKQRSGISLVCKSLLCMYLPEIIRVFPTFCFVRWVSFNMLMHMAFKQVEVLRPMISLLEAGEQGGPMPPECQDMGVVLLGGYAGEELSALSCELKICLTFSYPKSSIWKLFLSGSKQK